MTEKAERHGLFVTIEGIDGAGKSTQLTLLRDWLTAAGHEVVSTFEPGATPLGGSLRELLLHTEGPVSERAEALLYAADRAQHVDQVVRPGLERGAVVISDRYLDSSIAYQGAGRRLLANEIRDLSLWATDGLLPDLTVLLDLPIAQAASRVDAEPGERDRLESERADFHQRVRSGFLALAVADPQRFEIIDARLAVDDIAERIRRAVMQRLTGQIAADDSVGEPASPDVSGER
ncbi:dTMP kinase [Pseudoclavibacter sp. CFCC 11306]|uniref:dTMP kinase n=1 Tax=Pseudoclavibacter sp. CFCC 11306 TaxID=1564493 RepID=UPI001300FEE1|nr:dTMP kinase [Pseudoclavibacter sp. CFCC 11306]KAB1657581.1 dTMP kinase [Pseudoclavibacter sp. CFCC 11306]